MVEHIPEIQDPYFNTPESIDSWEQLESLLVYSGLGEKDILLINQAYHLAENGHQGQDRKTGGPYFNHPLSALLIALLECGERNPEVLAACLTHDLIEDVEHINAIIIKMNSNRTVADISQILDKNDNSNTPHTSQSIRTKIAERVHNLRTLPRKWSLEKRQNYIENSEDLIKEARKHNTPDVYIQIMEAAISAEKSKWPNDQAM